MTTPASDERRRGRFSRFLEKRKEKEAAQEGRPNLSNSNTNTDSAYASSDNDPARKTTPDFVPVENHDIQGVDRDRSLWLDKNNGEIYDEDTGDIVTTVTTTTTTTTTTTSRGGRKQEAIDVRTTQTEPQANNLNMNNSNSSNLNRATSTTGTMPPRETGGLNEMPAVTTQPTTSYTTTTVPGHTGLSAGPSTVPVSSSYDTTTNPSLHAGRETLPTRSDPSPPIPHKNPSRVSGEFSRPDLTEYEQAHPSASSAVPVSPTRHNFSYPSRSGPTAGTADDVPVRQSGSTLANLKAAAIAAHGIGETLRGTLNDAVDSRYPSRNTSKAEATSLKNRAAIDKGRTEMEGFNTGRHRVSPHTGTSYTDPTHTSSAHTGGPHTGTSYTDTTHTNAPHTGTSYTDTTRTDIPRVGTNHTDTTGPLTGNPTTINPDYHPPSGTALGNNDTYTHARGGLNDAPGTETKSSGLGKFFKRKPVADNQGQPAKYF